MKISKRQLRSIIIQEMNNLRPSLDIQDQSGNVTGEIDVDMADEVYYYLRKGLTDMVRDLSSKYAKHGIDENYVWSELRWILGNENNEQIKGVYNE
jgi:hypothetical protein